MRRMRYKGTMIAVLVLLALSASVVWAANPFVDGNIVGDEGWQGVAPIETDPLAANTDPDETMGNQYDIRDVYVRPSDDSAALFIGFDVYGPPMEMKAPAGSIVVLFDTVPGSGPPNTFCPEIGAEYSIYYSWNFLLGWQGALLDTSNGFVGPVSALYGQGWEAAVALSDIQTALGQPMAMGIHFENGVADEDDSVCFTWNPDDGGGEGCTPGYWKQSQHFGSWVSPYSPIDPQTYFDAAFGVNCTGMACEDKTLLQALGTGGGGEKALMRHAVAALLNAAANSGVDYLYTPETVIQMVKDAYAAGGDIEGTKNFFADENELGCPLGRNLWSPSE